MSSGLPLLLGLSFGLLAAGVLGASAPAPRPDRIRLEQRDLIPEGLAWDAADSVFYLSSIHRRSVFRVDRAGNGRELGPTGDAGAFGMLGLKVDTARRRLWACSTAFDAGPDQGRTAIYLFELPSGRVLRRFAPPGDARGPMVNDLVVTREGLVYATDTQQGSLQTIEEDFLIPARPAGTFSGPNGIALSPDERSLFVADDAGVHRLAMQGGRPEGAPRRLPAPPGTAGVGGIDGLYAVDGALIGIQNGLRGGDRILRLRLNAATDSIAGVDTLLAGHPLWHIPTTGTLVDHDFWYIANSQLDRLDDAGRLAPPESLEATTILRLRVR